MNKAKEVVLPIEEYEELINDQRILYALQGAGVDNWAGFDIAMEWLKKSRNEEAK